MLLISALTVPIRPAINSLLIAVALGIFSHVSNALEHSKVSSSDPITIFSAASLADIMKELTAVWQAQPGGTKARISLGASGVIARQIEAGAKADLFISANHKWITYLINAGFSGSNNIPVAANRISLVWPCTQLAQLPDMKTPDALKRILISKRFAMADPGISPAGDYTKTALEKLSIWNDVAGNATYASNVRLVLVLTERAGLPGFVYATDAHRSALACEVMKLPTSDLPSINYIAMLPRTTESESSAAAVNFQQWLVSEAAQHIWRKHGFLPTVSK